MLPGKYKFWTLELVVLFMYATPGRPHLHTGVVIESGTSSYPVGQIITDWLYFGQNRNTDEPFWVPFEEDGEE